MQRMTLRGYEVDIRVHVKPILGHYYIHEIRQWRIQEFILMKREHSAPSSVQNLYSRIKAVF